MLFLRNLAVVAALLAAPVCAFADSIQVEPGLWELTISLPDPFGGEPLKQVVRDCVRERNLTAKSVMARVQQCRFRDLSFKGPQVKWKMSCQTPTGPMNGSGSARYNSTSVVGALDLAMTLGSLELPVHGSFKARRVGACRAR